MRAQVRLDRYYRREGIAPVDYRDCFTKRFRDFCCPKKSRCRKACRRDWNGQDRFSFSPPVESACVSESYETKEYDGDYIPRIVVLSLSVPSPVSPPKSCDDDQESVMDDEPLNPHWRETLAMVRGLLHPFIKHGTFPRPANRWGDESRTILENLFVHLRSAKCCSNARGTSQEPHEVYHNCGEYLGRETAILMPDVIVTQGNDAHCMAQEFVFETAAIEKTPERARGITAKDSIARIVELKDDGQVVYWLRSFHPCFYGGYYEQAGPKVPQEKDISGAKRRNHLRYGEQIQRFLLRRDSNRLRHPCR